MSARRLSAGGRIDRSQALSFSLDGHTLGGFAGDTLASALLAGDRFCIARSFKYHRPRGFVGASVEEPNGLFAVGDGARRTSNLQGTLVELHQGLIARTQNAWPSVNFDLRALNGWFGSLLGAGFYYKTFMGPRRGSWMFYEPYIRRAAGLGRGVHERDPDRYDCRHVHTDVLVVGAGPAGLAAAAAAARRGARVLLVEQDRLPGGELLSLSIDDPLESWRAALVAELQAEPRVEILTRTTAFGLYDGNTVGLLERSATALPRPERGEARETLIVARAKAIVLATGAIEQPLIFANNDRPGIMLASAVRSYLNRYAVLCGERAVVATQSDSAWATAHELARAGSVVTIVDQRESIDAGLQGEAQRAGIEVHSGAVVVAAAGARRVRAVRIANRVGRNERTLECDLLCCSGGFAPTVHLSSHTGRRPVHEPAIDAFVPAAFASGHFGAGALMGVYTLGGALDGGERAGTEAARYASCGDAGEPLARPEFASLSVARNAQLNGPLRTEPAVRAATRRGKSFVDLQTDVTTQDLETAQQEGFESLEHLKRYTTLGMGTDQGKTANRNAIGLMAGLRRVDMGAAGTTTFRPPYTPVTMGVLAGRSVGLHFRPIRRTPLHDWHLANGAAMIEAGPWLRPWYYSWAGQNAAEAYRAEMRLVRSDVGLSDVSSLGKIDVQGPDAAEFLNRVYVNNFSTLPVGRARYGVMLNDESSVLDDGTTTRLSSTRYFMTTTTAQAAEVMSWLEFLLQTAWPTLAVQVVSLTDEWAGMSLAGPKARVALESAFPGRDFSDAALPYMGCLEFELAGMPLRVLRLSFSGELAYELYVPANRGVALWERLLECAAPLGIRPYGLESLAALRIEKGHVAGLELDHRTTLDDLGLGRMAARDKAFVGRELRLRPALQAAERWSLVGLECLTPAARLRGGAILFARGEPQAGHGRGYITSVTWSNELNKYIALALYQGGLTHEGEEIDCAFPLKSESVRARIVAPVFIDSKGVRLRA